MNRERMIAAAEAKVNMLKREYYPDFTLTGSLAQRPGKYTNMWGIATSVNIPIFYKTKQEPAKGGRGRNHFRLDRAVNFV